MIDLSQNAKKLPDLSQVLEMASTSQRYRLYQPPVQHQHNQQHQEQQQPKIKKRIDKHHDHLSTTMSKRTHLNCGCCEKEKSFKEEENAKIKTLENEFWIIYQYLFNSKFV